MTVTPLHSFGILAVAALVTALLRTLPFLIFRKGNTPPYLLYLGKVLPPAVMAMLVVYCLKSVSLAAAPHGLPEAIGIAATALLYKWKHNSLLSIAGGTACYMLLVQLVF